MKSLNKANKKSSCLESFWVSSTFSPLLIVEFPPILSGSSLADLNKAAMKETCLGDTTS